MCKTGCNACGGYWIKEPQSVTLTQIANACSRHEQQFTEQQQNKHENSNDNILKHVDVIGCQRFLRTPNNTKHSHHISFLIFRCGCPFEMVDCLLQTLSQLMMSEFHNDKSMLYFSGWLQITGCKEFRGCHVQDQK